MPVEIKQLIIRASVEEGPVASGQESPAANVDQDALVQACVKQVLRILKKEQQR